MAQEEARNVSENVKWNVQRRFREGVPIINHARFLGYTKDRKGGNLIIDPKEAEIVKLIFNLYIGGMGPSAIADRMMDLGHKTGAGKRLWRVSSVHSVLKNEKYMGDMLQQKTICTDYLNHTRIKNKNHIIHDALRLRKRPTNDKTERAKFIRKLNQYLSELERLRS